jgi:hypothetical protein
MRSVAQQTFCWKEQNSWLNILSQIILFNNLQMFRVRKLKKREKSKKTQLFDFLACESNGKSHHMLLMSYYYLINRYYFFEVILKVC